MSQTNPQTSASRSGSAPLVAGLVVGAVVGAAVPLVMWVATRRILWPFVIVGGALVAACCVKLALETLRGFSAMTHAERSLRDAYPYDPESQRPVIRASICSGERVAGFKDRTSGHFTEVLLLRSSEDEELFKRAYGIEALDTEY